MRLRAALVAALVLAHESVPAAQVPAGAVLAVLPFENPSGEPRLAWLREGVAILVADALAAAGTEVVNRDERDLAYDRLQLPVTATLTRASTIKVGHAVGATALVVGRIEQVGEELSTTVRLIRLDTGHLYPEIAERGRTADLFSVVPRLVQRLMEAPAPPAVWSPPPSLAALELYTKGLMAETVPDQRRLLEQALAAAPGYDAVRLALWRLHTEQGDHQQALATVDGTSPGVAASDEARFAAAMSMIALQRLADAFSTLRALQGDEPRPTVSNALGVVQLRRGGTAQTGQATYYFHQATEFDPGDADYFFNLGYAYWQERDAAATIYWLREAVRRDPGDGDAHFVLSAALQLTGAASEGTRERELARRLSSRYETRPPGAGEVPRGLERLHQDLDRPSARVDTIITSSGQRDQEALAGFHLDAARRAFDREADSEAEREVRRALYLSPYLPEAHLLLGRLHLRGDRTEDAIGAFKIALWSEETAAAHVALAEAYLALEDPTRARGEVDRALALEPASQEARKLRERLTPPK